MPSEHSSHYAMRPKGRGTVRRNGARWEAYAPQFAGVREKVGVFDRRRDAEVALEAWFSARASS